MAIDLTQIELTLEQKQLLARQAEQSGKPWAEILSEALRRCCVSVGPSPAAATFYDSMRDVIGIVNDAPSDLSTNPAHLESLGRDYEASAS